MTNERNPDTGIPDRILESLSTELQIAYCVFTDGVGSYRLFVGDDV